MFINLDLIIKILILMMNTIDNNRCKVPIILDKIVVFINILNLNKDNIVLLLKPNHSEKEF